MAHDHVQPAIPIQIEILPCQANTCACNLLIRGLTHIEIRISLHGVSISQLNDRQ